VVAMSGDVVQLVNHQVFVNGKMLVEGYTLLPEPYRGTYETVPEIPEGAEVPELPDLVPVEYPETFDAFPLVYSPGYNGLFRLDGPLNLYSV